MGCPRTSTGNVDSIVKTTVAKACSPGERCQSPPSGASEMQLLRSDSKKEKLSIGNTCDQRGRCRIAWKRARPQCCPNPRGNKGRRVGLEKRSSKMAQLEQNSGRPQRANCVPKECYAPTPACLGVLECAIGECSFLDTNTYSNLGHLFACPLYKVTSPNS